MGTCILCRLHIVTDADDGDRDDDGNVIKNHSHHGRGGKGVGSKKVGVMIIYLNSQLSTRTG